MSRVDVEPIMLMYAFRYALGRRTYAAGDVAGALIEHGARLRPDWREQIVEAIEEAIANGRAGMDCDVEKWRGVVASFGRIV